MKEKCHGVLDRTIGGHAPGQEYLLITLRRLVLVYGLLSKEGAKELDEFEETAREIGEIVDGVAED